MLNIVRIGVLVTMLFVGCSPFVSNTNEKEASGSEKPPAATLSSDSPVKISMPSLMIQDVNGNISSIKNLKGKKVFVNLWASWCPPCRREMPSIEKLYKSTDTGKVSFIMLSMDDDFGKAKKFIKEEKMILPIYSITGSIPDLFDVMSIPATFIFDEHGDLIKKVDGMDDYNTDEYRKILSE